MVAFVVAVTTFAGTVLGLANLYFRRQRPEAPRSLSPGTDERLARIEQAVDSIALEVERISEAQRFTAKLLAESHRPAEALPAARPEGRARG